MVQMNLTINNPTGLHARPAALFAKAASGFVSKVTLQANDKSADGKNVVSILALGVAKGMSILLMVDGVDETQCMKTLKELIESNFSEK